MTLVEVIEIAQSSAAKNASARAFVQSLARRRDANQLLRDPAQGGSRAQEAQRIDRLAVNVHFIMQMRAR